MSTLELHTPPSRNTVAESHSLLGMPPGPGASAALGSTSEGTAAAPQRRHDLDALRAFAMLLGIALHGALSFLPMPWPAQDSQQHGLFGLFVSAVHGFRMPVFFAMSGFFTAMLWRRRGLRPLVHHRFRRIFLPLLLGVVTLVPAVDWISQKGFELGPGRAPSSQAEQAQPAQPAPTAPAEVSDEPDPATGLTPLSLLAAQGNTSEVERLLAGGASANARNRDGSTPLILAALFGHAEIAEQLIEAGADLDAQGGDGSTALHTAAFFGRYEVVRALLHANADASKVNGYGQTPIQTLGADWQTTAFFANMVGVELEEEQVMAERAKIAELLAGNDVDNDSNGNAEGNSAKKGSASVGDAGRSTLLVRLLHQPFFHHLWFLWFLCWLVPAFALYAYLVDRTGGSGAPRALTLSPARLLWWVPLTALPQYFMGRTAPVFGADTSAGLLPMPHVLAYYAIFFFFGALYFDARDDDGKVGRWWFLGLPLALLVIFPIGAGIVFSGGVHQLEPAQRALSVLLPAAYAWLMLFALMGLFRRFLSGENHSLRYLSDSSYWLYLAHLPLILGGQILIRNWQQPAWLKFTLLCLVVTALLLVIYQVAVRYTWLGRLLNGPRQRPGAQASA